MAGTPPNATSTPSWYRRGEAGFGFVEFAWLGIPVSAVGLLYLISPVLPEAAGRAAAGDALARSRAHCG